MKHNNYEEGMVNRNTPPKIKQQLRHEVNFGCPICGSPYLTYHHFDPPWIVKNHYNPIGMIALCFEHHKKADGGNYTKEQLRDLKRSPYLSKPRVSQGRFEWLRNELILQAGGFYLNPHVYLRVNGQDMIWFNRDKNNNILLNLNIQDENGDFVVLMENNDWIQLGGIDKIDDIVAPPCGRSLTVKAKRKGLERFKIEFREYNQASLRKLGEKLKMKLDEHSGPQGPIGPLADVSDDDLRRIIDNSKSDFEREDILKMAQVKDIYKSIPSRWEQLTKDIKWPVTICKIGLKCKYPFSIRLSPTTEKYGGWKAKHSFGIESDVVWDLNVAQSEIH